VRSLILIGTLMLPILVMANEGGASGHAEGIPLKLIGYQTVNVVIMFAGLIYFLKDGLKKYFIDKRASFLLAAEKSEAARREAEQEHLQIQVKLSKLESTADESVARAKAEAADLRKQMLVEAEAISKRIKIEADLAAKMEIQRAKITLRKELVQEAIGAARTQLDTKVTAEDHQRLQSNFINNIQAVQR